MIYTIAEFMVKGIVAPVIIMYIIFKVAEKLDPFTRIVFYILVLSMAMSLYAVAFLGD